MPSLSEKLIAGHLLFGRIASGEEIAIRIDQTLAPDSTGTLVALELEAMNVRRTAAEISVQYVDHNLLQNDHKNPDDHRFLLSASKRFGLWYSRPGNGVSHVRHMERFGQPGATLLGADSHTPAAGALGMLAIGAGGLDVALAIAGQPFFLAMPEIWGVHLAGRLPDWVSAKDVILELLRRHGVEGGRGRIIEYHGPGLAGLSVMDRHVIANMGTELGATTSVFPSDDETLNYLTSQGRAGSWTPLRADVNCRYNVEEEIDLGRLEPLIALPSSPGNVVPVSEVAGEVIHQAYIGSSANPGYRDLAVVARIVAGHRVPAHVSLDVNPASRQVLLNAIADGHIADLLRAGARLHQAGCNGCIGMGQAPATGTISLRTVPRNFAGRSGTQEDKVCLVSPETAAASALCGRITDPRTVGIKYPAITEPVKPILDIDLFESPPPPNSQTFALEKGPNIVSLSPLSALPHVLSVAVVLRVGDDISTDEIMPAGSRVLPFRSNIPRMADFAFVDIDAGYARRARALGESGHVILGGRNYGQGSSREHAALVPRYLGLRCVMAISYARIHYQNLINFGVLPLVLDQTTTAHTIEIGDVLTIFDPGSQLAAGGQISIENETKGTIATARHYLTEREQSIVRAGGIINSIK